MAYIHIYCCILIQLDKMYLHVDVSGDSGDQATEAMHAIADAVTQCKFEATDPAADEVVLYKILQVQSVMPSFALGSASVSKLSTALCQRMLDSKTACVHASLSKLSTVLCH
jgi:brefeldin A-resistance guanine nucleotide exchange factor 1